MKLNLTWKTKTTQYENGEYLYLNRICIGGCGYNIFRNKDDKSNSQVGNINLPSISPESQKIYGDSIIEVKTKMEKIVNDWFTEALKEAK
jgi:hypothetical protein